MLFVRMATLVSSGKFVHANSILWLLIVDSLLYSLFQTQPLHYLFRKPIKLKNFPANSTMIARITIVDGVFQVEVYQAPSNLRLIGAFGE